MADALEQFRQEVSERKGKRDSYSEQLEKEKKKREEAVHHGEKLQEAQMLVQETAKKTQSELEYHVSHLVTESIQSVFNEDISMILEFNSKRGSTEAEILLKDENGHKALPRNSDGAGTVDIMSFGLRMVMYLLAESTSPIFILDEPFKKLNDPERKMHRRTAEIVDSLSHELGVQILIFTLLPELGEVADKEFYVSKDESSQVSRVEEINV